MPVLPPVVVVAAVAVFYAGCAVLGWWVLPFFARRAEARRD